VAREVYEIVVCGNVTMMQLALASTRAAGHGAVHHHARRLRRLASDFGVRVHPRARRWCSRRWAPTSAAICGGMLATGLTRDRACACHRCRTTRDRTGLHRTVVSTAAPPARRSRPRRSAAACGRRRVRSRASRSPVRTDAGGDRRHRPVGMCGSAWWMPLPSCVVRLLDQSGRYIPDEQAAEKHPSSRSAGEGGRGAVFVLAWRGTPQRDLLSQRDVRGAAVRKGSIATGWGS